MRTAITDEMEEKCLALKGKGVTLYIYPFNAEVASTGAKVLTRDGRTVKRIRVAAGRNGDIVTGILDGETLQWDIHGRFSSPYLNDSRDLYIPERYFDPDWKQLIRTSNAEWAINYQRPHKNVPEVVAKSYRKEEQL